VAQGGQAEHTLVYSAPMPRADGSSAPSERSVLLPSGGGEEDILLSIVQPRVTSSASSWRRPAGFAAALVLGIVAIAATFAAATGGSPAERGRPSAASVQLSSRAGGDASPRPRFCGSGGRSAPGVPVEFVGALFPRKLPFTILADIRAAAAEKGKRQVILDFGHRNQHCAKLVLNQEGALEYWEANNGNWDHVVAESRFNLVDGSWHTIAVTRGEHGNVEFLGDGGLLLGIRQLSQTSFNPGFCPPLASTADESQEGQAFSGDVTVLRIYNSALQRKHLSTVTGACAQSWAAVPSQGSSTAAPVAGAGGPQFLPTTAAPISAPVVAAPIVAPVFPVEPAVPAAEKGKCSGRHDFENVICFDRQKADCQAIGNCMWKLE